MGKAPGVARQYGARSCDVGGVHPDTVVPNEWLTPRLGAKFHHLAEISRAQKLPHPTGSAAIGALFRSIVLPRAVMDMTVAERWK